MAKKLILRVKKVQKPESTVVQTAPKEDLAAKPTEPIQVTNQITKTIHSILGFISAIAVTVVFFWIYDILSSKFEFRNVYQTQYFLLKTLYLPIFIALIVLLFYIFRNKRYYKIGIIYALVGYILFTLISSLLVLIVMITGYVPIFFQKQSSIYYLMSVFYIILFVLLLLTIAMHRLSDFLFEGFGSFLLDAFKFTSPPEDLYTRYPSLRVIDFLIGLIIPILFTRSGMSFRYLTSFSQLASVIILLIVLWIVAKTLFKKRKYIGVGFTTMVVIAPLLLIGSCFYAVSQI